MTTAKRLDAARSVVGVLRPYDVMGRVCGLSGLALDVAGLAGHLSVGDRMLITPRGGEPIQAEAVGFRQQETRAMAFGALDGIGPGAPVVIDGAPGLHVADAWLGRVIDPLGRPLDGRGPLPRGEARRPVRTAPPNAALRGRLGPRIDLGVKALNIFATCRSGQRLGLFAGSGVGKSTLLSMLARDTDCDVAVIALVGERGRELREFIEDDLGPEGMARAVVVVATSDQPPLMRRECAYAAATVAEHFRDQGKSVLLMMDSVTRFCLALREIGLSAGEPPTTRGYPPSVFAELPRLLERAGPGLEGSGTITGLFTVLVEGDDQNEPIADAVRGILDGHVVLDRRIAEGGRFRRSMSCARYHARCHASTAPLRTILSEEPGRSSRPGRIWRTWCASAPTRPGRTRWSTRPFGWHPLLSACSPRVRTTLARWNKDSPNSRRCCGRP